MKSLRSRLFTVVVQGMGERWVDAPANPTPEHIKAINLARSTAARQRRGNRRAQAKSLTTAELLALLEQCNSSRRGWRAAILRRLLAGQVDDES